RLGHSFSFAFGTGGNGSHLYGLHVVEAGRPEEPPSESGRTRTTEPDDASPRRRVEPRQPIPADAVPGQCGFWNAVRLWPLLDRCALCAALGHPRRAPADCAVRGDTGCGDAAYRTLAGGFRWMAAAAAGVWSGP